jgi:hypothetical protein
MESWGHFRDYQDLEARYTLTGDGATLGNNIEILPTGGPPTMPSGPQSPRSPVPGCLRFEGNIGTDQSANVKIDLTSKDEYIIGFNFMLEGWNESQIHGDDTILYFRDDGGNFTHVTVEVNFFGDEGEENLAYLGVQLGTGSAFFWEGEDDAENAGDPTFHALETGQWYYLEFRIKIGTTDGEVEVRVDGDRWFLGTGLDTSVGGSDVMDQIWFSSADQWPNSTIGGGAIYRVADLHIVDPAVAGEQDFLYPAVVSVLYPSAEVVGEIDFTPQSGTNNALMVDEVQHDYDTTYNESNTATDKDRLDSFTASVPESGFGSVHAVQVNAMVKDTADLGTRTARVVVFEGATEGLGSTLTLTESEYQAIYEIFEDNPDTTSPWAMAEVEASEIGYEIVT